MKLLIIPALAVSFLTVCACASHPPPTSEKTMTPASEGGVTYTDPQHQFVIAIPADMTLRHDFQRSYFDNAAWKAFANPNSQGTPAIALVLDGSNKITSAELRIGTSTHDKAVAQCLDIPNNAVPSNANSVNLAGTPFIHFHAGDAAMSHYINIDGYRTVHAGRCYAIDLMISGTRPEVFDPPATPPFQVATARQKLHDALRGFRLQD